jgi:hypothetical protein
MSDAPDGTEERLERVLTRSEARRRADEQVEKDKAQRKEALTARVSIAAIGLTMLLSFIGFARSERAGAAADASAAAARARADADASWAYYQTHSAERSSYRLADDQLARTVAGRPADDPRVREAEVLHADYAARVASIEADNRQIFFRIQDLERARLLQTRTARRISRKVEHYDLGTRVLTLAVVLLSVTLLANRPWLFWVGLGVAAVGAGIAVYGYFALF